MNFHQISKALYFPREAISPIKGYEKLSRIRVARVAPPASSSLPPLLLPAPSEAAVFSSSFCIQVESQGE